MRPIVIAKYVTAGAGILVFGAGMRTENETLRWVGIGIVAVAWFLRFVKEPAAHESPDATAESKEP
jgi:hypothetical protein